MCLIEEWMGCMCFFSSASKVKTSLLPRRSFGDAVTFFHEFGHLLHHVLGGQDQQYIGFSGIATAWDFVEAPSQMFEHWPHSAATLQSFTRTVVACGVSCADWCGCSSVPHRRRWLTSWKHQGLSRSGS
eukprot:m.199282 g.199282  ORF g.199282 m.199282 type:complete len:129 (+) comp18778_c0_seq8:2609-2995(+)